MTINEAWKKLEKERLGDIQIPSFFPSTIVSKHPVERLKKAYRISTILSIIFLTVFFLLLFFFKETLALASIIFMIGVYLVFAVVNFLAYKKIAADVLLDRDIRNSLLSTLQFVKATILFQERISLLIYPLAGASGFLIALSIVSNDALNLLNERIVLIFLVVVPITLTPICWFFARWMYRVSYGPCLRDLQILLAEIDNHLI